MSDLEAQIDNEIEKLFQKNRAVTMQSDEAFVRNVMARIEPSRITVRFAHFALPILLWTLVIVASFLLPASLELLRTNYQSVDAFEIPETKDMTLYFFVLIGALYLLNEQRKDFI